MTDGQNRVTVFVTRQPVELYKILKFEGLVDSGAHAKMVIDEGLVMVNGDVEKRRRRKIVHGDCIVFADVPMDVVYKQANDE